MPRLAVKAADSSEERWKPYISRLRTEFQSASGHGCESLGIPSEVASTPSEAPRRSFVSAALRHVHHLKTTERVTGARDSHNQCMLHCAAYFNVTVATQGEVSVFTREPSRTSTVSLHKRQAHTWWSPGILFAMDMGQALISTCLPLKSTLCCQPLVRHNSQLPVRLGEKREPAAPYSRQTREWSGKPTHPCEMRTWLLEKGVDECLS